MRLVGVIVFTLLMMFKSHAEGMSKNEIELQAEVLEYRSTQVLSNIETALVTMGDALANFSLSDREGHLYAKSVSEQLRGVRTIIYLDVEGDLVFDGLVWPTPDSDLSDREYFQKAKITSSRRLQLNWSVLAGRVTGLPFFPAAYTVRKDDEVLGVLVAIITPEALLGRVDQDRCAYCVTIITDLNGDPITQYPDSADIDVKRLTARTRTLEPYGAQIVDIGGGLTAKMAWRRNSRFAIVKLFLEIVVGPVEKW